MNRRAQAVMDSLERQGVDIAGIGPRVEEKLSNVHLRFDREALRFIDDVRSALHEIVPDGKALIFTITAPIRLASKTAATLEGNARGVLAHRRARLDLDATINGNHIRVRLVTDNSNERKVIGFVHNPDSDPEILFETTQLLLQRAA